MQRVREELLEVVVNDVGASLSIVPSALNFPVLEHVSVVGVLAAAMAPLFQLPP